MRSNKPATVNAWLDVMSKYDAATAAKIKADDVRIYVIDNSDDFTEATRPAYGDSYNIWNLARNLEASYGVTLPREHPDYPLDGSIWMNDVDIQGEREISGLSPEMMGAYVLVHEYAHINGRGEDVAYPVGCEFARKTGLPALISLCEEGSKAHATDGAR
jgi:hypothetical protein